VTALTLIMSSVYLALWLYVGSTIVNVAGAVILAAMLALQYGRRHAGAR